jgi:curved DNA-binding protein CbpA
MTMPVGSSPSRDPYTTLGLDHNASPTQIKVAYRKLALLYHPDRQQQSNQQQQEEATNKFAEISTAYAILSDPDKKSQYDHLYRYGAFDGDGSDPISEMKDDAADATSGYNTSYRTNYTATSGSGYTYTENLSGGYYTNKASTTSTGNSYSNASTSTSSATPTATPPPPFYNFIGLKKQDSFFDELLHTPTKRESSTTTPFQSNNCEEGQQRTKDKPTAQQRQQNNRSGIGFSIQPLGKHLSIHVPSKADIMTSVASGESNFGTRITFSTSERLSSSFNNSNHNGSTASLISTTTRIAHGQQRTVKRTVYILPDGKREEVIEENGVVKRRHVEELCPPPQTTPHSSDGGKDKENQAAAASCYGWHSGVIRGLRDCVLGPCFGVQGV